MVVTDKVRIDKWLWAVRYINQSQAEACRKGRIWLMEWR
jgi:ribosomal 50S subunit-recycling heat shock protein